MPHSVVMGANFKRTRSSECGDLRGVLQALHFQSEVEAQLAPPPLAAISPSWKNGLPHASFTLRPRHAFRRPRFRKKGMKAVADIIRVWRGILAGRLKTILARAEKASLCGSMT